MESNATDESVKLQSVKSIVAGLREVLRNTHAGVAIVGASILAEGLREALLASMRPLGKRMEKRMFEGYGPLGSFSSRIDLAFALRLVTPEIRHDLNTIRTIRNSFAHSRAIVNFTHPEIAADCKRLSAWDAEKTDLQAVYMESLKAIEVHLATVAQKGQADDSTPQGREETA